ncbi:MAG: fused response regulator/phosphatase [Gammaproteobacteria bacterium]|nr:fused response regulator/phosphatase [Gammaproteobacteria bacterium]
MILKALLSKGGHEVVVAYDGAQAVRLFYDERPDMVLMDVMMPVMDGYQAAREIKAFCKDEFVPIIFLTAMRDEDALTRCIESGGDDFLNKPYNGVVLQAKIGAMERIRKLYSTMRDQKAKVELYQSEVQREMELASRIFEKITSSGATDLSCIKSYSTPMSLFNGDILIMARKPCGGINLMLGDFTGHGLPAALCAMPTADIFYAMTAKGCSICEISKEINRKLNNVLPTGLFCAACLVETFPGRQSINVWNGGLPEILVVNREGTLAKRILSSNMPLGIIDDESAVCRVESIDLADNAHVFIYSDGLIEAQNSRDEMYKQSRLDRLFDGSTRAEALYEKIVEDVRLFRGKAAQNDDMTLVGIDGNLVSSDSLLEH